VALKLIAWDEAYPERDNDAHDIWLVVEKFADCGNMEALYDDKPEIFDGPGIDFPAGVARLVGRHVARILSAEARHKVVALLERECDPASSKGLARYCRTGTDRDSRLSEGHRLLDLLLRGVRDVTG
jgi:predicted nucleotidyltransferase